jgi:hypothetical protein
VGADISVDTRPGSVYVRAGDSLSKIAARFPEYGNANDLKNQLIAANPLLSDPNALTEGMELNFPGAGTVVDSAAMARAVGADGRYQTDLRERYAAEVRADLAVQKDYLGRNDGALRAWTNEQFGLGRQTVQGPASNLGDPDVLWGLAAGFYDEGAGSGPAGVEPGSLFHTSLAATAWRADHEIKLGAALYAGLGGNAELTLVVNPSRLDLSATEFEWGLGVGLGAKGKAGWETLKGSEITVNAPRGELLKRGDGQASGTGAVSMKAGLEFSAPAVNLVAAEIRLGVQSPLSGAPAATPTGGFYEIKVGEVKVAPTLQLGATAKIDLFNNSYKRTKP